MSGGKPALILQLPKLGLLKHSVIWQSALAVIGNLLFFYIKSFGGYFLLHNQPIFETHEDLVFHVYLELELYLGLIPFSLFNNPGLTCFRKRIYSQKDVLSSGNKVSPETIFIQWCYNTLGLFTIGVPVSKILLSALDATCV